MESKGKKEKEKCPENGKKERNERRHFGVVEDESW